MVTSVAVAVTLELVDFEDTVNTSVVLDTCVEVTTDTTVVITSVGAGAVVETATEVVGTVPVSSKVVVKDVVTVLVWEITGGVLTMGTTTGSTVDEATRGTQEVSVVVIVTVIKSQFIVPSG